MMSENMGDREGRKKNTGASNTAASMAAPVTVVLMVDMHCDGCVARIVRSARRLEGAEKVKADPASNKLTVIGFLDPSEVAEKLQKKSKKKVELISPQPKKENKAIIDPNFVIKTPAKVAVTTTVLKLSFHCEGCIKKIHKTVSKTKGVYEVTMDEQKEQVTVTGTMDVKWLTEILKKKLKRTVETVPPPKKEREKKPESHSDSGCRNKNKTQENSHQAKLGSPSQPGFAIGYAIGPWPGPYGFSGPVREIFSEEDSDCCCVM